MDEYRPPYGRTVLQAAPVLRPGRIDERDGRGLPDRRHGQPPLLAGQVQGHRRRGRSSATPTQLWAEAVARYRAGERTWLAAEEAVFSTHEQKQRFMEDAWQERIARDRQGTSGRCRIDDVLAKLELKPKDINNMVKKRVKNSLRQLGWYETRRAGEGRVWRPGGVRCRASRTRSAESWSRLMPQ